MLGFEHHDHHSCIRTGVDAAEDYCNRHNLQFTPQRRRVLEILLERHAALGAYDILEVLREDGLGAQPPVAYRALEFLVSHGFAHKIERLNAFVACAHMGLDHTPVFLICSTCDKVAETHADNLRTGLPEAAQAAGFQLDRVVIEATGRCPACQKGRAA